MNPSPTESPNGQTRRFRGSVALTALPLIGVIVFGLLQLDVGALLAGRESTATLLRTIGGTGLDPAGVEPPNPAAAELVARLCDGRITGDEARSVTSVLWPMRVTIDGSAQVGETISINARLLAPALARPIASGPTLTWRLVDVRIDDARPIAIDAPPTLSRLASAGPWSRWDMLTLPATRRLGPLRLTCQYEYELLDAAGQKIGWRESFECTVRIVSLLPAMR